MLLKQSSKLQNKELILVIALCLLSFILALLIIIITHDELLASLLVLIIAEVPILVIMIVDLIKSLKQKSN